MEFRILGPLEVRGERGAIEVPGAKPRMVLAVLLLHANKPVRAERLAEALSGAEAPSAAIKAVRVNVSRLRKALGNPPSLETTAAGYRLRVGPGELDSERFEELLEDGRKALRNGQPERAGTILREALALWRGPPLADVEFEPFAQAEIARLDEERQSAIEARVEADLGAGRHDELVGELRHMAAEHPTRERLAAHLMLALYRCGRQSEALDAYREARRRLTSELGIEPSEELQALQDAILHHDPSLKLPRCAFPPELEAARSQQLIGRGAELDWLRERWEEAQSSRAQLVVLAGPKKIGKTRLAAEIAYEIDSAGAAVLYASGRDRAGVYDALDLSRLTTGPFLLVVDDADRAGEDVLAAVQQVAGGPALVLATARDHDALRGLDASTELFLDLGGLDSTAVAEIAALYVPTQALDAPPAEWLLGASAGVPGQVHEVAKHWARRRVGAVAERAAKGRARLRSMEDEIAGVVRLQAVRESRSPTGGEQHVVCPFKGLVSFEREDAPYFFGRERLVAELVARLVGASMLGIVGPSGSGKSSVLRAGLLPALASDVIPGSEQWEQRLLRPGEHPLRELRRARRGRAAGRQVLAIDQFEETFTVCRDEPERAAFISELVRAVDDGSVVLLALRADFYGRCADYPALSRLLTANHVLVGQMRPEEVRRAVACPAERVGLTVERELVDAIVNDVTDAPGALPLLSTALLELWQDRDGRRLRLASYTRTKGIRGAVARLAEKAFADLDASRQALARHVFLQLVDVDEDGNAERRRMRREEVDPGEDAGSVLKLLADRRLVTISEGIVELAHEALLREWPRLAAWLDEDRESLRIERSLKVAAREWERVGRDDGALYRGSRLSEARESSRSGNRVLGALERDFLNASVDRSERDRRARRRGIGLAFAALTIGIVTIGVIAAIAIDQRGDAQRQRDMATSRELALQAQKMLDVNPQLAVRLALSALEAWPTNEAGRMLREATAAFRQRGAVRADSARALTLAASPDGARLVTGGEHGRAVLWDVAKRSEAGAWNAGHGAVDSARFAPDGRSMALGFEDGTVAVTDASLGGPRTVGHVPGARAESVAFVGDGARVAAAFDDGRVRIFATDGSTPPQILTGHRGAVLAVAAGGDEHRLLSAGKDGTVRLWNLDEGTSRLLRHGRGAARDVTVRPGGTWLMAVGDDTRIRRWDAQGEREAPPLAGGGSELYTVAFSGDGRRFAAAGQDGVVRVWATAGGPPIAVLRGQSARINDLALDRTGDRVMSAGDDGTVRFWDARAGPVWAVPGKPRSMAFSADGRFLATSSDDGVARVWEAATGREEGSLRGLPPYMAARFAPAGNTLLVTNVSSPAVRAWPISQPGAQVLVREQHGRGIWSARFDRKGDRIAYVPDESGTVVIRNVHSRAELALRGGPDALYLADFSPDGEHVAAVPDNGRIPVWRVDHPDKPERVLTGHQGLVNWLEYGPDGRLVTAGEDRTARVWPAGGGPSIPLRGHTDVVTGAVFYDHGSKVLSTSFDGTLRLWDSHTGMLLAVLMSGPSELHNVAVAPDGEIAVLAEHGIVHEFKCVVCQTLDQVRARALAFHPRALTSAERRQFIATG